MDRCFHHEYQHRESMHPDMCFQIKQLKSPIQFKLLPPTYLHAKTWRLGLFFSTIWSFWLFHSQTIFSNLFSFYKVLFIVNRCPLRRKGLSSWQSQTSPFLSKCTVNNKLNKVKPEIYIPWGQLLLSYVFLYLSVLFWALF